MNHSERFFADFSNYLAKREHPVLERDLMHYYAIRLAAAGQSNRARHEAMHQIDAQIIAVTDHLPSIVKETRDFFIETGFFEFPPDANSRNLLFYAAVDQALELPSALVIYRPGDWDLYGGPHIDSISIYGLAEPARQIRTSYRAFLKSNIARRDEAAREKYEAEAELRRSQSTLGTLRAV